MVVSGYDVSTKEEFDAAIKDAIEQDKVCFMNVQTNRFEDVHPMVPSGGALFNMMLPQKVENNGEKK